MFKESVMKTVIAVLACIGLGACAPLSPPNYPRDLLGTAVDLPGAQRTIVIRPDTRWANVVGGEIIRFVVDGREFAWSFDGPARSLDLQQVAPPGVLGRSVIVYIEPNPLYRRDRWGD
jgi:hypothetical protein